MQEGLSTLTGEYKEEKLGLSFSIIGSMQINFD
jgi:hypothetical protein